MSDLTASNGVASWPIVRVSRSWCFHRLEVVDAANEDEHYDPDDPCPGPHGELYAAKP